MASTAVHVRVRVQRPADGIRAQRAILRRLQQLLACCPHSVWRLLYARVYARVYAAQPRCSWASPRRYRTRVQLERSPPAATR
jgi:hypothetical protein